MNNHFIELTNPQHAYMFGFIQADGNMSEDTRNRGKLRIEIKSEDECILEKFAKLIPCNSSITKRIRNTNFSNDFHASCLTINDLSFRSELLSLGIPYGKKSNTIKAPTAEYSKVDYFRGLIDGDGSLGITSNGFPFISLITTSNDIEKAYNDFIFEVTGQRKENSRNKRDNAYNIMLNKEDAQKMVSVLYYDGCLALPRKLQKASEVLNWKRPDNMKKRDFAIKKWTIEEDNYILNNTVENSILKLGRTKKSIETRLWRLRNK